VWFPNLTDKVNLYVGDVSTVTPFYTTGVSGCEGVPLPSGTLGVTLQSVDGTGAVMQVYFTSLSFDPIKTTAASATVSAVTATTPLTSSGGANPNIALTTPLAIGYGGTGSASPSLVAGSGISITGSWPNQTVASSASTGGGVMSVSAAGPITSTGGQNPTLSLTGVVPVANGGTGTASPSIVGGTSVLVTGTWPNQTVNTQITNAILYTNSSGLCSTTVPYVVICATATMFGNYGTNAYVVYCDYTSNFGTGTVVFRVLTYSGGSWVAAGSAAEVFATIHMQNNLHP
jgi:hypothetical protein